MPLVALPVAIPLLMAAILSTLGQWLPRRWLDALSILTALAVTAICLDLMMRGRAQPLVYWFGGWKPEHGAAIGIGFVVDALSAGAAAFTAFLTSLAFVFSWHYFKAIKSLYHALMLVFMAAMCGFSLTGDLFNLFVWFELMSASAIALCGYKSEELAPLRGAINFAVTNTVGAFLALLGIAILYSKTGALNLAQIAQSVGSAHDGWVIAGFLLVTVAFWVKAAVVPFHFWLADAHAVAPTPVCMLFSGIMVELGLFAVAKIYWWVFASAIPPELSGLRGALIGIGTATALVGGIMCFSQRHIKRLLAFSTVSHVGLMVIGLGLLRAGALAATAAYVLGHGLVKAALFVCAGILLHRFGTIDEFDLRGRGRVLPITATFFVLAGAGLAGAPPFLSFLAEARIDEVAEGMGHSWIAYVFTASGILTAGAVFRIAARVFWGFGEPESDRSAPRQSPKIEDRAETEEDHHRTHWVMVAPPVILLGLAIALSFRSSWLDAVSGGAAQWMNQVAISTHVLQGASLPQAVSATWKGARWPVFIRSLVTVAGAIALAVAGLYPRRAPQWLTAAAYRLLRPMRELQSGRIGDYIAWLSLGVAVYGGLFAWIARH